MRNGKSQNAKNLSCQHYKGFVEAKNSKEWLYSLKNNKLCVQSIIGFGLNQAVWKRRGQVKD
jgi:hypothetical protein